MNVSFKGLNEAVATFNTNEELPAGRLVKLEENGTVAACEAGDAFIGITAGPSRKNLVAVQFQGYAEMPSVGGLKLGLNLLASSDNGATVKTGEDTEGKIVTVLYSDDNKAGFLM